LKTILSIFSLIGVCLLLSFSKGRKGCQLSFGVNSKFKVEEQAKDGTVRQYTNSRGTFKLRLLKVKSGAPESESIDSLKCWLKSARVNKAVKNVDYDTLVVNNISLKNISYSQTVDNTHWKFNTFVFISNSHYYKMEIKYLSSKEEKSKKEISKILNSLEIDC